MNILNPRYMPTSSQDRFRESDFRQRKGQDNSSFQQRYLSRNTFQNRSFDQSVLIKVVQTLISQLKPNNIATTHKKIPNTDTVKAGDQPLDKSVITEKKDTYQLHSEKNEIETEPVPKIVYGDGRIEYSYSGGAITMAMVTDKGVKIIHRVER